MSRPSVIDMSGLPVSVHLLVLYITQPWFSVGDRRREIHGIEHWPCWLVPKRLNRTTQMLAATEY